MKKEQDMIFTTEN